MIQGTRGFTLIELSVVLVIIGLIVSGILVGQNLIIAAGVRAQISQIEKYNSAVSTFYGKYQALPGDMSASVANQFGFAARGPYAGEGDGNGLIEGNENNTAGNNNGLAESLGETAVFWVDLSTAGFVDSSLTRATETSDPWGADITGNNLAQLLPTAKIGQNNYVYVYSSGSQNYFGVSAVTAVLYSNGSMVASQGLTVQQAYSIDTKIDDGMPTSGRVQAYYNDAFALFNSPAYIGGILQNCCQALPSPAASSPVAGSCMDNGNVAGRPPQYSLGSFANYGAGMNCSLTFKMQGAGR